jgi:hypothetical protein
LACCFTCGALDDEKADVLGLVRQRLSLNSAGRWLFILNSVD